MDLLYQEYIFLVLFPLIINQKNKRMKFKQLEEKAFAKERTQYKAQDNHTQLI